MTHPLTGNAPERLWLASPTEDGEHQVWFDPDEGGTEYIRADLVPLPSTNSRSTFISLLNGYMNAVEVLGFSDRPRVAALINEAKKALAPSTQTMEGSMTKLDEYLERILKSAGSSLRHYTPQSKENLRSEMAKIIAEIAEEAGK